MKKLIPILALIAVIGAGIYAFSRWQEQRQAMAASNVQTIAAERGQLIATIGATGRVRSRQTAILSWKITGTVSKVNVAVGEVVKSGQVLAELEQTSLPQNVILAQGELVSAEKALADLETAADTARIQAMQAIVTYTDAVNRAQYQLDNFTPPSDQVNLETMEAVEQTRLKLDAARAAFEPYKFFPSGDEQRKKLKEALDEAQSAHNTAVKRLDYEYRLAIALDNLERAQRDYEKWKNGADPQDLAAAEARRAAAQATLQQAWIEAPFDATVTIVNPKPGDQVAPNVQAFRLDDLSKLYVDVQVSEVDINQIAVDQEAILTFDAILGKEYRGKVIEVAPVGTSIQEVTDFNITIELLEPDELVKPGMTAAVNIVVRELADVLLVPNRAVRIRDGRQTVYILKNGQIMPVVIQLGASGELNSQVVSGDLQVGDAIVLNPPTEFQSNGPPPFVQQR